MVDKLVDARRITVSLVVLVSVIVTLLLGGITLPTTRQFEEAMLPELNRKAEAIGAIVVAQVERAVSVGVPLDRLNGMDAFAARMVAGHGEVRRVTLTRSDGAVLYAGDFGDAGGELLFQELPVENGGARIATLAIGVSADHVNKAMAEIAYDVVTLLFVSLLLTFEIILVVGAVNLSYPIVQVRSLLERAERGVFSHVAGRGGRDEISRSIRALDRLVIDLNARYRRLLDRAASLGTRVPADVTRDLERLGASLAPDGRPLQGLLRANLSDVRLPLFVFFFATELSRSFLPLYAAELHTPIPLLSQGMAIALPMTVYVLASALLTPLAGGWADRMGTKRLFLLGLVPTVGSLAGQGMAGSLAELSFWRGVEGLGFAMVSIAALGYIQQASSADSRARGSVVYTAAFVTAGICGTSIGGILADRVGFSATLLFAAALAVLSAALLYVGLNDPAGAERPRTRMRLRDVAHLCGAPAFVGAALLLAFPAQMMANGFIYFATPLMLHETGLSTSAIGRIMMGYFLTNVIASQFVARLADRAGRHRLFAAGGMMLSGLAALLPAIGGDITWMVAGLVLLGIAQAVSAPSRGAIMLEECGRIPGIQPSSAISAYRLIERCGGVAGPMIIAALIGTYSYEVAFVALGIAVTLAALAYLVVVRPGSAVQAPVPPSGSSQGSS